MDPVVPSKYFGGGWYRGSSQWICLADLGSLAEDEAMQDVDLLLWKSSFKSPWNPIKSALNPIKSAWNPMKSPCADPQFLPRNRSWCPELPSLINHAAVVSMMPLHRAVDTEVRRGGTGKWWVVRVGNINGHRNSWFGFTICINGLCVYIYMWIYPLIAWLFSIYIYIHCVVVWNMNGSFFQSVGNKKPNWRTHIFSEGLKPPTSDFSHQKLAIAGDSMII